VLILKVFVKSVDYGTQSPSTVQETKDSRGWGLRILHEDEDNEKEN